MARTKIVRIGTALAGASMMAALVIGGASAASAAVPAPTTPATTSSSSAPASPTTHISSAVTASKTSTSQKATNASNNMIHGVNLTVKNTTKDQIAVTFNYDGAAGGQAQWTWLSPGQSTSVYNATDSGPDVYNSYVYFPSTNKQIKFESKLAAWSADTTITFDGTTYELDRGQSRSDRKQGHAITVSRGSTDLERPKTEWIDGLPTVAPDMVLDFTL